MKKLIPLIIVAFAISTLAQEKPSLNSWKGLVLEQTTPDDATKSLGTPTKDKSGEKFVPTIYSNWFGNKPIDGFRVLTFKGIEGFDRAELYFKDGILMVIDLDLKKDLTAATLIYAYDSRFYPLVGNFGKAVTPAQLAEPDRNVDYPEKFPLAYNLGAANSKTLGLAYASSGLGETLAATMVAPRGTAPTAISASLPGLVRRIQLISRKLEYMKGVDFLR